MENKSILKVIDDLKLDMDDIKIWYIPIRNAISIQNYKNTVLKGITFNNQNLNSRYWGFKSSPKNELNFNNMNPGDYILFICRDSDGYEFIDSVSVVKSKYINKQQSINNWNNEEYELIIEFDSVFILLNKLKLTKNRTKLNNILKNVPNEIFHNGYEMFRQWNLREKLSRTKLGNKLIDEETFILLIKDYCDGSYVYSNYSEEEQKNNIQFNKKQEDSNDDVREFFNLVNDSSFKNLNNVKIRTKINEKKDSNKSLSNKIFNSAQQGTVLNKLNQKIVGLTGEKFIYNMLLSRNINLLKALSINNEDDILDIKWSNLGYEDDIENFKDLSLGSDIEIQLKDKSLKLEIKTSFKNSGYYSITRNELKEMLNYKENYFIVKVNHLSRLKDNNLPEVTIENFPIFNILENINRVKSMDIYI